MRMLHFSAENGRFERVWFTEEDTTAEELIAEFEETENISGWRLDWELRLQDDYGVSVLPCTETPYDKV